MYTNNELSYSFFQSELVNYWGYKFEEHTVVTSGIEFFLFNEDFLFSNIIQISKMIWMEIHKTSSKICKIFPNFRP